MTDNRKFIARKGELLQFGTGWRSSPSFYAVLGPFEALEDIGADEMEAFAAVEAARLQGDPAQTEKERSMAINKELRGLREELEDTTAFGNPAGDPSAARFVLFLEERGLVERRTARLIPIHSPSEAKADFDLIIHSDDGDTVRVTMDAEPAVGQAPRR